MPSNNGATTTAQALAQLRELSDRVVANIDETVAEARVTLNLPTDGRTFPEVENLSNLDEAQLREVIAAMQTWRSNLSAGLQSFADDHQMHSTWDGFVTQYGLPGRMRTYMVQQERSVTAPVIQRRTLLVNARSPQEAETLARNVGQTVSSSNRAQTRLYDDWSFQQIGSMPDTSDVEFTTLVPRLYS